MDPVRDTPTARFFWALYGWPKLILVVSALVTAPFAWALPGIVQDARIDSNLEPDDPVYAFRNEVKRIFNISDPLVIAVLNTGPHGVFTPHTLRLIDDLTQAVKRLDGVDPEGVKSLATEKDIIGTEDALLVERFFEEPPRTQAEADAVREAVLDLELYRGNLVARDGSASLIVIELLHEDVGDDVYAEVWRIVEATELGPGEEVHIAGEGAVSATLGEYIDSDARRLNPIAFVMIAAVLWLSYRTLTGLLLPLLVVLGSVTLTLGAIVMVGESFYTVTNSLTVILIGISVADGIHILGEYYLEAAERPRASARELVTRGMTRIWRPVLLTSVTSAAGFISLALTIYGPPLRAFGWFAAVGVMVAFLFSIFTLPAILVLLPPRRSPAFRLGAPGERVGLDWFGRLAGRIGRSVVRHPVPVLVAIAVLVLASVGGISRVVIEDRVIGYFRPWEPIRLADDAINREFDGTTLFDVYVEAAQADELYEPDRLRKMDGLQTFLQDLPHVQGTQSIVDYVKQMNRALNADAPEAYRIPDSSDLIAQYFLLYTASSDPTDFEQLVDYDFRLGNVRVYMNDSHMTRMQDVVDETNRYLEARFNDQGFFGQISGRAAVYAHWLRTIESNHRVGITLAFVAVWLTAVLTLRSLAAGTLAMTSVALALLMTYGFMGAAGIWLRLGTSMIAPMAIGLSVDYSIHTIARLADLVRDERLPLSEAFYELFPSTGRALSFNFSAIMLSLGVLASLAATEQLRNFGLLVCVCIFAAFIASFTAIPALVTLTRPRFLFSVEEEPAMRAEPAGREGRGS